MIEPIPDATDVAGPLGNNRDADAADLIDQKPGVSSHDDDPPPTADRAVAKSVAGRASRPAWKSGSLTTRRSFVKDMASLNEP